ncbi:hypothetical protein MRB53_019118 [Persea americana]|uniref:Uncharacterized protein n=1 Tax=Persea americana TaxID=3435 RepID=A0ACC2M9Y9_PERAE|nr:hypothetical protein MRB53_019118 [Persea americana]
MTSRAISPSRCHPFDWKRNSLLRSHAFSLLGGNAFHMLREFVRSAYSSLPLSRTPNSVCSSIPIMEKPFFHKSYLRS